ncbi:receptor-like protein kinase 5 isoform X1 [Syzygium oleosum]|uniref:receptor-like protein kinase 5 isoform X1 n=1 Tax=Syzygium oleosum TaxID=219896 RepID=UPI0024BB5060|nr:receptor-like protein kinase 5 isoform X1 [Syzygium oleosum]
MPRPTSSPPHIHIFFFLFYIPCLVFLCFLSHLAESQIQDQEQQVLLKLRQSWQDPSSLAHWVASNSSSHCTWPEITCQDGSITELNLVSLNVNYSIPPFICDLKNLTKFNVSNNKIPGEFPTVLYNCSKLVYLDLSQNYFEGPIPPDINRMTDLQVLILATNSFAFDIPASIARLRKLRILHLYQSEYNGTYPKEIFGLSNLEELRLGYNDQFVPSELPQNFTALKKLWCFSMPQTNLFGGIPETVGDMESLELLDLGMNLLTGEIPGSIFVPRNLSEMYEYMNNVSRSIPQAVSVANLTVIDLSANNLTGNIPEDFGKLKNLSKLNLEFNQFSGGIPESIGRLPALSDVRLSNNNLSGTIPPDFGKFSTLRRFEVAFNNLTGVLPKQLCHGGTLFGLAAMDNNLGGELPESLGNCSSLVDLRLNSNGFTGIVPGGLWTLPNLTTLILSGNELTGELPEELSPNLTRIEISNNRFFGKFPSTVSSWKNLVVFDASNNFLSSTVLIELTELPSLKMLLLGQNELSGDLPPDIVSWKSLSILNLSHNRLSGPIPREIGLLPALTQLDLSENQLSGSIPSEIGLLKLNLLNLSSNRLSGQIPEELENATYDASFLNNPGLCASSSFLRLNVCNAQSSRLSKTNLALIVILAIVGAIFVLLAALFTIRACRKKRDLVDSTLELTAFQRLNFTESNILSGLEEHNVIGRGGSGKVYRIILNPSGDAVAVKRISNNQKLDEKLEKQFVAEVGILGNIRHLNIIKLLCCISCENSKLIVYEYMENKSLDRWIHKMKRSLPVSGVVNNMILDWPKRLKIALGAAKGLCYMHHYCLRPIIHRDVKSSNILLDSEFNAKIADFGLARMLAKHGEATTVTGVAGSFGYLAPEYAHTTKVNEKIDVYSFGVVLLELTTGRDAQGGDEDMCLADWAWRHILDGKAISDAIDEEINNDSFLGEISNVFKLGISCTAKRPSKRPPMKKVVQVLLKCSDPLCDVEQTSQHNLDVAPLLRNPRHEEMPRSAYRLLRCNTY